MYIKYTYVHFAILLFRQSLGVVPLPVTSPFAVEALSLRLRYRLGLLHLSSNLLAVLLEVPLLSLCPFLETSGLVNHQHLMLFLDFYLHRFQHREELGNYFRHYSSLRSSSNLEIVTRELCQLLSYLED